MNGIEKLTGRIYEEAEKEASTIIGAAEKEAHDITAKFEATALEEYEIIVKKGKLAAEQREERLASSAKLEAKKLVLESKQAMVSKAFELALEKLKNLDDDKYISFLSNLTVEASRSGNEQILLSENDRTKYGTEVVNSANKKLAENGKVANISLSDESAKIEGGLILKENNIEMNCSFEMLLKLKRDELATEVSKVLFN